MEHATPPAVNRTRWVKIGVVLAIFIGNGLFYLVLFVRDTVPNYQSAHEVLFRMDTSKPGSFDASWELFYSAMKSTYYNGMKHGWYLGAVVMFGLAILFTVYRAGSRKTGGTLWP